MTAPRVVRLPMNTRGRDFLAGDIHGSYQLVVEAMRAVQFDQTRDRLLCVGDLIDRGPESHRTVKFLAQPWVHAVRGNHEEMALTALADGADPAILEFMAARNGMGWLRDAGSEMQQAIVDAITPLPYVIEVETPRGLVGLVHADVPKEMTWQQFTAAVEAGDEQVLETAVWGRDRLHQNDESGVEGIGRVFVGHTPVNRLLRLGNIYAIDTGACYRMANIHNAGALTFVEACSMTGVITDLKPTSRVSVAEWDGDTRPFSKFTS